MAYKLSQESIDNVEEHLKTLVKAMLLKAPEVMFPISIDKDAGISHEAFEDQYAKIAESLRYELYQGIAAAVELDTGYAMLGGEFQIAITPQGLLATRRITKAGILEVGEIKAPEKDLVLDDLVTTAFHVLGLMAIKDPLGSAQTVHFSNAELNTTEVESLGTLLQKKDLQYRYNVPDLTIEKAWGEVAEDAT